MVMPDPHARVIIDRPPQLLRAPIIVNILPAKKRFILRARANGIDIFRIFDSLNDVRNMAWAMQVTKRQVRSRTILAN
mgnify:CR=1 FL=1